MRRGLRSVAGPLLLGALATSSLFSSLPRIAFSGSFPFCLPDSASVAWLGVNLHLLAENPACPSGSYLAESHFIEIAQLSLALSLSTLIVSLVNLVLGLGGGWWLRRTVRTVGSWMQRRIGVLQITPVLAAPARVPVDARPAPRRRTTWSTPRQHRGPPSTSC